MDADADVVIAGAGPAGIAAAVAVARRRPDLAERGRIICFDKACFPREKPCGGGLTGHARTALFDLGLRVRVPAVPCSVGRIVYGGLVRTVRLETPVDVIRREEFDADLIAQARMIGVVVNEDEGIASHEVDETRGLVGVATSRGRRLNTRVLVAADGAGSRIRRQLLAGNSPRASMPSLPERSLPLRLFKHEIPAPPGFPAEMVYDFSPMDDGLRGYVWMFPVAGGRVNVGAMHTPSRRMSGSAVVEVLERTLARHGISLPPHTRGWPAWPYVPDQRLSGPHVLSVGDAAGIDALTGEGIAVGLEHGPIAATFISRALASGEFSFSGYAQTLRRATVGRELALDSRVAAKLYARDGFRFWLSLVMFDDRVRGLYAARVCGSKVLSDEPRALLLALGRHALAFPWRLRRLARAAPIRRESVLYPAASPGSLASPVPQAPRCEGPG